MRRKALLVLLAAVALAISVAAQNNDDNGQQPRRMRGERVHGTITAIAKDQLTIEDESHQATNIVVSDETRVMKDGAPAKLGDLKVGDKIFALGERKDEHTLVARGVMSGAMPRFGLFGGGPMTPEQKQQLQQMGLGSRFVVGEVKAIEDTKITVARVDGETQTIVVDENTSFKNQHGESVTLADIKPGDRIGARGAMKDGVFTAEIVRSGVNLMMQPRNDGTNPPPKDPNAPKPKDNDHP